GGRIYHRVIAEKALEAWVERLQFRKRSAVGNAKRYGKKAAPELFDAKIEEARAMLEALRGGDSRLTAPLRSGEGLPHGSEVDSDRGSRKKPTPRRGVEKENAAPPSPPAPASPPAKAKPAKPPAKPKAKKKPQGTRLPVGWYAKPDE